MGRLIHLHHKMSCISILIHFFSLVYFIIVTLEHKTSLMSLGFICDYSQKYIVWVKIIDFSTLFKISSFVFFFFALSDSRYSNSCISAKYCPIITNHTSMELTLMTDFVVQGHNYATILTLFCLLYEQTKTRVTTKWCDLKTFKNL